MQARDLLPGSAFRGPARRAEDRPPPLRSTTVFGHVSGLRVAAANAAGPLERVRGAVR